MVDKLNDEMEFVSWVDDPTDEIVFYGYTIPVKHLFNFLSIDRYGLVEGHIAKPEYDIVTGDWISDTRGFDLGKVKHKSGSFLYFPEAHNAMMQINQETVKFKGTE